MITVRQIERAWDGKAYDKLFNALAAARPEGSLRLGVNTKDKLPAAALAIIRLDELAQSHVKLYSKLVAVLLRAQEADGGWGDPVTTALCLRALLCGNGDGAAIERGLGYLADLQKAEGIWPQVPIRRMPADPYLSAVILYQLSDQPAFRRAICIADAARWFETHSDSLDTQTRSLWNRVRIRYRLRPMEMETAMSLS